MLVRGCFHPDALQCSAVEAPQGHHRDTSEKGLRDTKSGCEPVVVGFAPRPAWYEPAKDSAVVPARTRGESAVAPSIYPLSIGVWGRFGLCVVDLCISVLGGQRFSMRSRTSVAVHWDVWPLAPHSAPQRQVENRQAARPRTINAGRTGVDPVRWTRVVVRLCRFGGGVGLSAGRWRRSDCRAARDVRL